MNDDPAVRAATDALRPKITEPLVLYRSNLDHVARVAVEAARPIIEREAWRAGYEEARRRSVLEQKAARAADNGEDR